MRIFKYFLLAASTLLLSCNNDEVNIQLNPKDEQTFTGTFKSIDSDDISGTVSLQISDGYYYSTTNLPFGYGSGQLEVNESSINFIDTLFFVVPAIYGPSYVLSGEHHYRFDGDNLEIWRAKNVGDIKYKLKLTN
jgi:hypothetical protein